MNKSILIIGRISSGKSTLAKGIQDLIPNFRTISFGSYLREYSELKNMKIDRQSLQDLGQRFVVENPISFLIDVVRHNQTKNDEILIFEGVRHQPILNAIRNHYPVLLSIYLDIDVETRYDRYLSRNKIIDPSLTKEDFLKVDSHQVELEIESLKNSCDLVLEKENLADAIEIIKNKLRFI